MDFIDENLVNTMFERLDNVYMKSKEHEREAGKEWYKQACKQSILYYEMFNVNYNRALICALIAVFSPATKWTRNLYETEVFLQLMQKYNCQTVDELKGKAKEQNYNFSNYGNQIKKAITLYNYVTITNHYVSIFELLPLIAKKNNFKTQAFALNIFNPYAASFLNFTYKKQNYKIEAITVDRHIFSIALDIKIKTSEFPDYKTYIHVVKALEKFRTKYILTCQLSDIQAILWVSYRNSIGLID